MLQGSARLYLCVWFASTYIQILFRSSSKNILKLLKWILAIVERRTLCYKPNKNPICTLIVHFVLVSCFEISSLRVILATYELFPPPTISCAPSRVLEVLTERKKPYTAKTNLTESPQGHASSALLLPRSLMLSCYFRVLNKKSTERMIRGHPSPINFRNFHFAFVWWLLVFWCSHRS